MTKFAYHTLSEDQFEQLVIVICQTVLGSGTHGFAKGRDGGRDGKFVGVTNGFPSNTKPWVGTTIIQAKHTNNVNGSFSEKSFFSANNANSIIRQEVEKVKTLKIKKEIDNYILFSNRKLTGLAQEEITNFISTETKIPKEQIYLCGIEQLELWFKKYPELVLEVDIDPIESPLSISPESLAEVVEAISRAMHSKHAFQPPTPRIDYEDKNKKNAMSKEYATKIRKKYLKDTPAIDQFLADPNNKKYREMYDAAADEIDLKITAYRKSYHSFEHLLEFIVEQLYFNDVILSQNTRLTRVMIFYMYWNCDIGSIDDDPTI